MAIQDRSARNTKGYFNKGKIEHVIKPKKNLERKVEGHSRGRH